MAALGRFVFIAFILRYLSKLLGMKFASFFYKRRKLSSRLREWSAADGVNPPSLVKT